MPKRPSKIDDPALLRSLENALVKGALTLPDACRVMRARKGWTQEQFAAKAGVALKVVKQLESGKGNPKLESLERVAAAAGLRLGFVRPAGIVRIGLADDYLRRQALVRRSEYRALARGKTSLKKLHVLNALQGSDFTIELPALR